jgi:hypothetical protein
MRRALLAVMLLGACKDFAARPPIVTSEAAAFSLARREERCVLLHVYAGWSIPSVEVDRALRGPQMEPLSRLWIIWHADVSDGTDADVALQDKYRAHTLPAVVLLGPDGQVLNRLRGTPTVREILSAAQTACAAPEGPGQPASAR